MKHDFTEDRIAGTWLEVRQADHGGARRARPAGGAARAVGTAW